jgi:hypothetical protein
MRSLGDPNWPLLLGVANFQKIMHELCRTARPVEMAMFLQGIEDSGAVIPADFLDRAGGAAWPTTPFLDPDTLEPSLPDMDNIAALRQSNTPAAARPVATSTSGREVSGAEMKGSVDATRGSGGGEVDKPPALLGWLEARKQHLSAVLVGQQLEKRTLASAPLLRHITPRTFPTSPPLACIYFLGILSPRTRHYATVGDKRCLSMCLGVNVRCPCSISRVLTETLCHFG